MTLPQSRPTSVLSLEALVRERRSIRAFSDEPISRDMVKEILQDALWSPSPHNSQPWRFTVLFNSLDKVQLANAMAQRLHAELVADGLPDIDIERQTKRSRGRISSAPVAILCSLAPDGLVRYPDLRRSQLEWQMAVQSVGAVLQTLLLLAHARDIGTCWMAAPMYCPDVVRTTLDLPEGYVPQALVLMGFPARPGRIRERRPLADVVELR